MNYEFHPEAKVEYFEAITYYEERQPGLGARFTIEIENTIQRIVESPLRWQQVEGDIRRCLAHKFPYGILYAVGKYRIFVLAVMHHSREPDYWRDRT